MVIVLPYCWSSPLGKTVDVESDLEGLSPLETGDAAPELKPAWGNKVK